MAMVIDGECKVAAAGNMEVKFYYYCMKVTSNEGGSEAADPANQTRSRLDPPVSILYVLGI